MSAKGAERISLLALRKQAKRRTRGWLPIAEWGPKCAGCGGDEFRLNGYCSLECRDYHDDEDMEGMLALVEAVEAAQRVKVTESAYGIERTRALLAFDAALARFDFSEPDAP